MKRLMSTRRTSAPFADSSRNQNGTNDSSRIMDANHTDTAQDHEHAHDNPASSAHDDDDFGEAFSYPGKDSNFLSDLQNATSKHAMNSDR